MNRHPRFVTGAREARIVDALYRNPLTLDELTVALHRADAIPMYWTRSNVGNVVRRLHRNGTVARLAFPSVTRSVLWWTS